MYVIKISIRKRTKLRDVESPLLKRVALEKGLSHSFIVQSCLQSQQLKISPISLSLWLVQYFLTIGLKFKRILSILNQLFYLIRLSIRIILSMFILNSLVYLANNYIQTIILQYQLSSPKSQNLALLASLASLLITTLLQSCLLYNLSSSYLITSLNKKAYTVRLIIQLRQQICQQFNSYFSCSLSYRYSLIYQQSTLFREALLVTTTPSFYIIL